MRDTHKNTCSVLIIIKEHFFGEQLRSFKQQNVDQSLKRDAYEKVTIRRDLSPVRLRLNVNETG